MSFAAAADGRTQISNEFFSLFFFYSVLSFMIGCHGKCRVASIVISRVILFVAQPLMKQIEASIQKVDYVERPLRLRLKENFPAGF